MLRGVLPKAELLRRIAYESSLKGINKQGAPDFSRISVRYREDIIMNPITLSAIIAGIFAISAPIASYFVIRFYESSSHRILSHSRRKALEGKWTGKVRQEVTINDYPSEYEVSMELNAYRRTIKGKGSVRIQLPNQTYSLSINIDGGFLHERFARLDYENSDVASIQFGIMLLELNSDASELSGRFLGYGARTEQIVYGTLIFEKTN